MLVASVALALTLPAAELFTAVDLETSHTSNVFLDRSEEWDVGVVTRAELGVDLEPFWSLGYVGELSLYGQHEALNAHFHELYLFANPAMEGDLGRTDLLVELSLSTLRNQEDYAALNLLRPALTAEVGVEPRPWLRARLSADLSYLWLYDAPTTSAVDAWVKGSASVNLPSHTTLTAWARLGVRCFTQVAADADDRDLQLELAAHVGQGLWPKAGLQLDYVHRHAFGPSGLLLQSLTDSQLTNVGTEFLYSGDLFVAGLKQMLGSSAYAQAFLRVESRRYEGWPALDEASAPTGEDRRDLRLSPGARVALALLPEAEDSPWPRLDLSVEYRYLSQGSTSAPFDTQAHLSFVSARAAW
jgi:hypothetical protein